MPTGKKTDRTPTLGAAEQAGGRGRYIRLTGRQTEIIRLIAKGCSDKEVASRLGISHRTVRTHIEKVFEEHGIRSRTEAAAEWLRQQHEAGPPAAADECPFTRPFPEDFAACPAYLPRLAVTLDLSAQPVDLIRSCRHLVTRESPDRAGRSYGACVIGGAAERKRWVRTIGAERLRRIGMLRQELAAITLPMVHELWAIKRGEQRRRNADPAAHEVAQEEMEGLSERLLKAVQAFLEEHRASLDELEIPVDGCLALIRLWLDSFIRHPDAETRWQAPADLMESFPEEIRMFLATSPS
jgi:DNA-binding CsgD family transcriptional regulator